MIFFDSQRLSDLRSAILADLKDIIPPGYYDFVEAAYRTHYDVELTRKVRKLEQDSSLSPRLSAAREVLMSHTNYQLSIQRFCTKYAAYLESENHHEELINDLKEEINFLWKTSETLLKSVRYWVSYLSEREERIFHPDNLGYSVDNAKERIISFCGTGAKFLSDHIDVLCQKSMPKASTSMAGAMGDAIVECLRSNGYDPLCLPQYTNGLPGVRASIRDKLDFDKGAFDRKWQELLNKKLISYISK